MDQFDEIDLRNKRIIKIIIGLVSFSAIIVLLPLSFFIYANISLNNIMADVDYELIEDGEISKSGGIEYAKKLENIPFKFIFEDQYQYNYYLSEAYDAAGEYEKMIISAQKMVESGYEHPVSHYYLGWAYYNSGNYDDAEKELEKSISMMDNLSTEDDYIFYELDVLFLEEEIEIHKALAYINIKNGNLDNAKTDLAFAIDGRIYSLSKEYIDSYNENLYYNYYGSNDLILKTNEMFLDKKKEAVIAEFADEIAREHSKHFDGIVIIRTKESVYLVDTDGDGLSDNLEKVINTSEFEKDTDKDGFDDKKELVGGYNPLIESPSDEMEGVDYYNLYFKIIDL